MFTLRRADERLRVQVQAQETWRTFRPPEPAEAQGHKGGASELRAGGFGVLETFDEIRLPPGAEVVLQPDREAETITYVLKGALAQEDSTGHTSFVRAGEFQRMTLHRQAHCSERNASQTKWAHFIRMSLHPAAHQADNTNGQKFFSVAQRRGLLCVVGSQDGRRRSLHLFQDAVVLSSVLSPGHHVIHEVLRDRMVWLHIVNGEANVGGLIIVTGDGVGINGGPAVSITAQEETEILLLDLARPANGPGTGQ